MLRLLAVLICCVVTVPALAQNPPSPFEQALAQRLSREIDGALQCSAALITTQQAQAQSTARIKALEDKYEPKPPPAAPASPAKPE